MTTGGRGPVRPWQSTLLTLLLVVPVTTMTVLYALQVEVLDGLAPRALIATGVVTVVPVGLFLLRLLEERREWRYRRREPGWPAVAWFLVATLLIAGPLIARVSLGARRAADGQLIRDVHRPGTDDVLTGLLAGFVLALAGFSIGALAARIGTWAEVTAAVLAMLLGLATVPATLFGLVLSYEVASTPADHPLADTLQTMGVVWFVPVPLAAGLAGRALVRKVAVS
ncbi:MAG TPA: hypothetical protein VGT61_12785 [Thermomicrobiales bacterium]|nr:hypothetical protein [Thermomicrobiales bacterium]